ncbi:sodium/potassium/calcium exchanger 5-like, partial [Tropilaelaps mercedesae]
AASREKLLTANFTMNDTQILVTCMPSSINDFPKDLFTQEERMAGGIAIHVAVIVYMCGVMGIVCDRYFVPSLEITRKYLNLSSDVAGATLMAIGTSAPELFSSVIGSFITEGDIGVGTIVGSAVFNILGVAALIGLAVGRKSLKIDWFPISRDCIVYMMSVTLLVITVADNYVSGLEAVILLSFYAVYVTVMVFNTRLERAAHRGVVRLSTKMGITENTALLDTNQRQIDPAEDAQFPSSIFKVPDGGLWAVVAWLLFLPANIILACMIPDVRGKLRCLFPLTFLLSIICIGVSSYITVWMVTVTGYTLGLPDTIAGLTILAAGTSVPEVFASMLVAKSGQGNMALCNLLGSNIFDILFCLGAPWLAKIIIANRRIVIQSAALAYTSVTLLTTVVLFFTTLLCMKWKVNYKTGIICLALYSIFIALACFYEFFVFGFGIPC